MSGRTRSAGMALVEAMVASLVLSVGALGAARLVVHAEAHAQAARAQARAERLAHEALDCALAAQTPCPMASETVQAGLRYSVRLERLALGAALHSLQATVEWAPEAGGSAEPRRLRWQTRASTLPNGHGLSSP